MKIIIMGLISLMLCGSLSAGIVNLPVNFEKRLDFSQPVYYEFTTAVITGSYVILSSGVVYNYSVSVPPLDGYNGRPSLDASVDYWTDPANYSSNAYTFHVVPFYFGSKGGNTFGDFVPWSGNLDIAVSMAGPDSGNFGATGPGYQQANYGGGVQLFYAVNPVNQPAGGGGGAVTVTSGNITVTGGQVTASLTETPWLYFTAGSALAGIMTWLILKMFQSR